MAGSFETGPTQLRPETDTTALGTVTPATVRYIIIPLQVRGDALTGLYAVGFDVDAELAAVTHLLTPPLASPSVRSFWWAWSTGWSLAGCWPGAGRVLRPIRLLRDAAVGSSSSSSQAEVEVTRALAIEELDRMGSLLVSISLPGIPFPTARSFSTSAFRRDGFDLVQTLRVEANRSP